MMKKGLLIGGGLLLIIWPMFISKAISCGNSSFVDWLASSSSGYTIGALSILTGFAILTLVFWSIANNSIVKKIGLVVVTLVLLSIATYVAFYNAFGHCLVF